MAAITTHRPGPVDDRDRYFFDLNGYLVVRGALGDGEVASCRELMLEYRDLKPGEWAGWVHGHTYGARQGINLQQLYEAGAPFERLMDHPSWFDKVREFIGAESTLEHLPGSLSLNECLGTMRGPGEAIPMHSGGTSWWHRDGLYLNRGGRFRLSMVNVIIAFTDIGPGDGGTMVVPASHKAAFDHPDAGSKGWGAGGLSMDDIEGAVEVHMRAGDALVFAEPMTHGAAARTNPGLRMTALYRYAASYTRTRYPYKVSPELLGRLSTARRQLVQPVEPVFAPPAALV